MTLFYDAFLLCYNGIATINLITMNNKYPIATTNPGITIITIIANISFQIQPRTKFNTFHAIFINAVPNAIAPHINNNVPIVGVIIL